MCKYKHAHAHAPTSGLIIIKMDTEVDKEMEGEDFSEELEETQEEFSQVNTIENDPLEDNTEHTNTALTESQILTPSSHKAPVWKHFGFRKDSKSGKLFVEKRSVNFVLLQLHAQVELLIHKTICDRIIVWNTI